MIAGSGNHLVGHLSHAVAEHLRWCRCNGVAAPPELAVLLSVLQADGGPGGPALVFEETTPDAQLMSYQQAAAALNVSTRTVRRLVADGRLPVVPIGARRLVRVSAVDEYVTSGVAS